MAPPQVDHEFLQDTIVSHGGRIIGGYVRAWVQHGKPSNIGWSDIDCWFDDQAKFVKVQTLLKERMGDSCPQIDNRYLHTFNDFFCNCWQYDGNIKLMEPAASMLSFEELREETLKKQARCIVSWRWASRLPYRVKKLLAAGFVILHPDKTPVAQALLRSL